MATYLFVYLGSALAGLATTPLAIYLGRRLKVLDHPGVRKIHDRPIPRLGGVAIALPVLGVTATMLALGDSRSDVFLSNSREILVILGSATFMLVVGLIDDVRSLGARRKLAAQLLAASVVCAFGVRIDAIGLPGLGTLDLGMFSWPFTIFWIVGMTNVVNLIDGLDGLAAGITAIACGVVAVFALHTAQPVMAILMLACLGTLCAFLLFNFNPAKIFLGDSGTYFVGFILGAGSILTSTKSQAFVGLALPLLTMGIPVFDTLFCILRRFLELTLGS